MEVYGVCSGSQEGVQSDTVRLSPDDRRIFLGSMLRLVIRRYSCGQPVLQSDLLRLVSLADDSGPSGVSSSGAQS
jgi:hypothetical protein